MNTFIDPKAINNNRYEWIDYAKGIAIILVVFRHVIVGIHLADFNVPDLYYQTIVEFGVNSRMPLFFILSGLFFSRSIMKRSRNGYFMHKLKSIMYPYLVWSVIQMTLQIILSDYTNEGHDVSGYLLILYKPRGQFWFLYALFNIGTIYLLLHRAFKGNHWLLIFTGLLFYLIVPYLNAGKLIYDICRLFIFFVIGDVLAQAFSKSSTQNILADNRIFIALLVSFFAIEYCLFNFEVFHLLTAFFAMIGVFFFISLAIKVSRINNHPLLFLRIIGYHSMYIFLLHALISAAVRIFFKHIIIVENVFFIHALGTLAGVLGPIIFYSITLNFGWNFLFYPPSLSKAERGKVKA